jgi:hypothetical protein
VLIVLALAHAFFPRYFGWKDEFSVVSQLSRQMFYVHTLFVALTVFLMGLLCLTSSRELIYTALGNKVSLGFGIFWGLRLFIQFWGYSSELWRGKRFETSVHIVFSIYWAYLTVVFFLIFWQGKGFMTACQGL